MMNLRVCLVSVFMLGMVNSLNAQHAVYRLENAYLTRTLEVSNGILRTRSIVNKVAKKELLPLACGEFALRISKGTDKEGTDRIVTSGDFLFRSVSEYELSGHKRGKGYKFILENKVEGILVNVYYELSDEDSFCYKYLQIESEKDITLERIDIESIAFNDALQCYTTKEITARGSGRWKPGLGQPLYTMETATYWGVEFPATTNQVINKTMYCGYLYGFNLPAGQRYTTYKSVFGVSDDIAYIDDAFYAYIDKIRKRPLRLQIQYNSWFDFGKSVSEDKFIASINKVNHELVSKRGCSPLKAFVIDDGWQDANPVSADWSDKVWTVNSKFHPDFVESRTAVNLVNSKLGLWLSPASILGSLNMVPQMEKYGYEALSYGMSMTGAIYMQKLEERILELASQGISYFKFDGLFGHLNIRDFELQGRGTPAMPQLKTVGFSSNDERLNEAKYDELKLYYLSAGTARLMKIFNRLGELNPEIFIAITNGAYLSPWWLQYVDVVWMINAGDAAKGDSRTKELIYRDDIYHRIWKEEHTKFPMNSIFNHEPKKVKTGEASDVFRNYLYMNLSRGTGFVELYIKTELLSDADWNVLADGLKWAEKSFPFFKNVRMHGGSPRDEQVYGYTAWNSDGGYLSIHNPADKEQLYEIILDRKLGLSSDPDISYELSSPLNIVNSTLKRSYAYGETLSIRLKPKEILVFDFTNLSSATLSK